MFEHLDRMMYVDPSFYDSDFTSKYAGFYFYILTPANNIVCGNFKNIIGAKVNKRVVLTDVQDVILTGDGIQLRPCKNTSIDATNIGHWSISSGFDMSVLSDFVKRMKKLNISNKL